MALSPYRQKDIVRAYQEVGVVQGSLVILAPDLRWLGPFSQKDKKATLEAHFQALAELIDLDQGTLAVSTPSVALCNTEIPFDLESTPSELGMLTEYVRTRPEAVRSMHPFTSYSAVGCQAGVICNQVSRHSFGPHTPIARMMERDALCVSLGLHPRFTCSEVHHAEMLMGVPYRYVKEFIHPVVRKGKLSRECFYMFVRYLNCDIERNKNQKIFKYFEESGHELRQARLGRGQIYAYSMGDLVKSTLELMSRDIYAWLEHEPQKRPYRK